MIETAEKVHILDFDIENRPLTYMGGDYTSADITAIAWSWAGEDRVECFQVGRDWEEDQRAMLERFHQAATCADILTGHYIRKHDLPLINAGLLEHGLSPLPARMTSDTKLDLIRRKELSASQESLAEMLGVPAPKIPMSQPAWRAANRRTPEGLRLERERVMGDVVQHKLLRLALVEQGLLKPPRVWAP